jgi:hypothetical protein
MIDEAAVSRSDRRDYAARFRAEPRLVDADLFAIERTLRVDDAAARDRDRLPDETWPFARERLLLLRDPVLFARPLRLEREVLDRVPRDELLLLWPRPRDCLPSLPPREEAPRWVPAEALRRCEPPCVLAVRPTLRDDRLRLSPRPVRWAV